MQTSGRLAVVQELPADVAIKVSIVPCLYCTIFLTIANVSRAYVGQTEVSQFRKFKRTTGKLTTKSGCSNFQASTSLDSEAAIDCGGRFKAMRSQRDSSSTMEKH